MSTICRMPQTMIERDSPGESDDFRWYISPHIWTSTIASSGTSAVSTTVPSGILVCTTAATDNDSVNVAHTSTTYKFAAGKPCFYEALIQYTEANTSAANIFAGFSSISTAGTLVNDGAGPATSFSGAFIYKVDGGTVWKCVTSNATTQTISTSTTTAGTASLYSALRVEVLDFDSSNAQVRFYVDGKSLRDSNNRDIIHTIAYASIAAVKPAFGVKAGSTTIEVLNVDRVDAYQVR